MVLVWFWVVLVFIFVVVVWIFKEGFLWGGKLWLGMVGIEGEVLCDLKKRLFVLLFNGLLVNLLEWIVEGFIVCMYLKNFN